jgi:DNA-binding response OmpR family regulator
MNRDKQILVVDDESDLVRGISLRLTAAGFGTCSACDGDSAIAAAVRRKPDAIVLDVRMPGRDGLSVLKELRSGESTWHIPVVMLSASLVDQQRALDAGAHFFLPKPYDGKQLVAAITAAIDKPQAAEESHGPIETCAVRG